MQVAAIAHVSLHKAICAWAKYYSCRQIYFLEISVNIFYKNKEIPTGLGFYTLKISTPTFNLFPSSILIGLLLVYLQSSRMYFLNALEIFLCLITFHYRSKTITGELD